MTGLTLFGSRSAPWRSDAWKAVDDRIRGGKSQSHLVSVERMDGSNFANFYGNLDIKTLGGAGFASQSHRHPYDLHSFDGLRITLMPSAPRSCTIFTLNIKTALPGTRPDGRRESVIVYEFDFDASEVMGLASGSASGSDSGSGSVVDEKLDSEKESDTTTTSGRAKTYTAEWRDFKPTYRGRPVPPEEAKKLDPKEINEISIMCRSNFGKQSGDFNLYISDITAYKQATSFRSFGYIASWWNWLSAWFMGIFGLRQGGRGFIRL